MLDLLLGQFDHVWASTTHVLSRNIESQDNDLLQPTKTSSSLFLILRTYTLQHNNPTERQSKLVQYIKYNFAPTICRSNSAPHIYEENVDTQRSHTEKDSDVPPDLLERLCSASYICTRASPGRLHGAVGLKAINHVLINASPLPAPQKPPPGPSHRF